MKDKSVLLLGGTGAMGQPMQEQLLSLGYRVCVTSRKKRASDRITYYQGNARDLNFLQGLLSENVFDSIVDFMGYSTSEFLQRAEYLLQRTGQYVFISSARVYAPSKTPLTESSPRLLDVCDDAEYLASDEYALSKARQEDILYSSKYKNWTIVRPSLTYNADRLQYPLGEKEDWLFRVLKGHSVIVPRNMMDIETTLSYGADVSRAISLLIDNAKAISETVHVAGGGNIKWSEVMDVYRNVVSDVAGIPFRICYVDDYEKASKVLNRYYQIKYARAVNRVFDNTKLKSLVGETQFLPVADGLRLCLEKFLSENRTAGAISWKSSAYFDKLAHERMKLSEFKSFKAKAAYLLARYTPLLF